jgi:hypothetical protein
MGSWPTFVGFPGLFVMTFDYQSLGWLLRLVVATTLVWSAPLTLGGFSKYDEIEFSGHGKHLFVSIIESEGPGSQRAFRQSFKADPVLVLSNQDACSGSADGLQLISSATAGLISHQTAFLPVIRAPPHRFPA